jgi:hypothetical protein
MWVALFFKCNFIHQDGSQCKFFHWDSPKLSPPPSQNNPASTSTTPAHLPSTVPLPVILLDAKIVSDKCLLFIYACSSGLFPATLLKTLSHNVWVSSYGTSMQYPYFGDVHAHNTCTYSVRTSNVYTSNVCTHLTCICSSCTCTSLT